MPAISLPGRAAARSLDVPAAISGIVSVVAFSAALAHAGLVGRYDAQRALLVIEPAGSTSALAARIEELGAVQERNPPSSAAWQAASDALQPLFREMASRQRANGGERDWRKWSTETPPQALDPLCGHCGGSGFDGDDACRFCDATGRDISHNT
jgi:hypothetical protein